MKPLAALFAAAAIFAAPWLWWVALTPLRDAEGIERADAAIVFGALVRDGAVSPLHRQRLLAARDLLDRGLVRTIVLSNAPEAVSVMEKYLVAAGVAPDRLERDVAAFATVDSCLAEAARGSPRRLVLVSQGFHLPRINFLCTRHGVSGQFLAAERVAPEPPEPLLTTIRVRGWRLLREAALTWSAILWREEARPLPA